MANTPIACWTTHPDADIYLASSQSSFGSQPDPSSDPITVDDTRGYQEIEGFGFALTGVSATLIASLSTEDQSALFDSVFKHSPGNSIGVTMLRISIGASDLDNAPFTYDDTDPNSNPPDPNLSQFNLNNTCSPDFLTVLDSILKSYPDVKLLATPWTAPVWMKDPYNFVGGSLNSEWSSNYADYFVTYIQKMTVTLPSMSDAGSPRIWAVTPQNEPGNPTNNPSMAMSAAEQYDFINSCLVPAFRQNAIDTKIIVFDHNPTYAPNPNGPGISNDPNDSGVGFVESVLPRNATSYAEGAAFHLYKGDISNLSLVYTDTQKDIYFTEQFTNSDYSAQSNFSFHMPQVLIGSLRNWAKTVFQWNLANDPQYAMHTYGGCSNCEGAYTIDPTTGTYQRPNIPFYNLAQGASFIVPGALRIASTNTDCDVSHVAAKNPDGTIVTIVFNGGDATQSVQLAYQGDYSQPISLDGGAAITLTWPGATGTAQPEIRPCPAAIETPSALISGSCQYVLYTDQSNQLSCFFYDGVSWHGQSPGDPLGCLALAQGGPSTVSRANADGSSTLFALFRTTDNGLGCLCGTTPTWGAEIPSRGLSGARPVLSPPAGVLFSNQVHAVYRDDQATISDIFFDGQQWNPQTLNDQVTEGSPPLPAAATADPATGLLGSDMHVVYPDSQNTLSDLYYDGARWHYANISGYLEDGETAAAPVGPMTMVEFANVLYILYRDNQNMVTCVTFDGNESATAQEITATLSNGDATPAPAGAPAAIVFGSYLYVYYRDAAQDIVELTCDSTGHWSAAIPSQTVSSGKFKPAASDPTVSVFSGQIHVSYVTIGNTIGDLWWDGQKWYAQDLNGTVAP